MPNGLIGTQPQRRRDRRRVGAQQLEAGRLVGRRIDHDVERAREIVVDRLAQQVLVPIVVRDLVIRVPGPVVVEATFGADDEPRHLVVGVALDAAPIVPVLAEADRRIVVGRAGRAVHEGREPGRDVGVAPQDVDRLRAVEPARSAEVVRIDHAERRLEEQARRIADVEAQMREKAPAFDGRARIRRLVAREAAAARLKRLVDGQAVRERNQVAARVELPCRRRGCLRIPPRSTPCSPSSTRR